MYTIVRKIWRYFKKEQLRIAERQTSKRQTEKPCCAVYVLPVSMPLAQTWLASYIPYLFSSNLRKPLLPKAYLENCQNCFAQFSQQLVLGSDDLSTPWGFPVDLLVFSYQLVAAPCPAPGALNNEQLFAPKSSERKHGFFVRKTQ